MVDTFNQKKTTNALGGASTVFGDSNGGRLEMAFSSEDGGEKGHSLELVYDVSRDGAHAGYVTGLRQLDLRGYQALSFIVKGAAGQDFLVGMKDRSGHEHKVRVSRYLPNKILPDWQRVTIPLVAFASVAEWAGMENLSISFEGPLSASGQVLVDEIVLQRSIQSIVVETFDDPSGENRLGGRQWTFAHGAAAVHGKAARDEANAIYGITYGGNIGDPYGYDTALNYAGWSTELRGVDCSRCGELSFRIRGATGGEKPNIYLDDGTFRWGIPVGHHAQVTTNWQVVTIPLRTFADYGVDLTHLAELQFAFEWEKMSGTIYLDDIQFGPATHLHAGIMLDPSRRSGQ